MFQQEVYPCVFPFDNKRPVKCPISTELERPFDRQRTKELNEVRQGLLSCQTFKAAPHPSVVLEAYLLRRKGPHQHLVRQGK